MIPNRSPKRKSLKKSSFYQGIIFFLSTVGSIICLIFYLWVFKEIDESILSIEIQNATARSLKNEIDMIKNDLEKLNRADVICLLYTSPSPRDATLSRMPSSA